MPANGDALVALYTFSFIPVYLSCFHRKCRFGTAFNTLSAGDTYFLSFWVVAISTVDITTLKEYGNPVPGTVYYTEGKYFIDRCGKHINYEPFYHAND